MKASARKNKPQTSRMNPSQSVTLNNEEQSTKNGDFEHEEFKDGKTETNTLEPGFNKSVLHP